MDSTLALFIALVSYGNRYIKHDLSAPDLDFNNSTLIYCNELEFTTNIFLKEVVAKSPGEWFRFLKKNGSKELRISYRHSDQLQVKDYEMAGFVGGGGEWIIEVAYGNYTDYWVCQLDVVNPDANDHRIWNIQFAKIKDLASIPSSDVSIENAKADLSISLSNIIAFSSKHSPQGWTKIFEQALRNLSSQKPEWLYYKDCFVIEPYSLPRKQLFTSAATAYVFGGMGSWNDIWYDTPELEKQNSELSADLYDKVVQAVVAAVNIN